MRQNNGWSHTSSYIDHSFFVGFPFISFEEKPCPREWRTVNVFWVLLERAGVRLLMWRGNLCQYFCSTWLWVRAFLPNAESSHWFGMTYPMVHWANSIGGFIYWKRPFPSWTFRWYESMLAANTCQYIWCWQDEITAACVADNGRKIYLGDAKGRAGDPKIQKDQIGFFQVSWVMGVAPNHPLIHRIFHSKTIQLLGTPMTMESPNIFDDWPVAGDRWPLVRCNPMGCRMVLFSASSTNIPRTMDGWVGGFTIWLWLT